MDIESDYGNKTGSSVVCRVETTVQVYTEGFIADRKGHMVGLLLSS